MGLNSEKMEALYAELNKRVEAATSIILQQVIFLMYLFRASTKNHQDLIKVFS